MTRGRPREFDKEKALDMALKLFWQRGYEGTSLAALSQAMGINPPSLYAAFGSKEQLFASVVERYIEKPASYLHKAIAQPTARAVAEQALNGAIEMVSKPGSGDGCLMVHGALATSPTSRSVRQKLAQHRAAAQAAVCQRFEQAQVQGDLSQDANPSELACYLMTVIWGMSVQAAGGASRTELQSVARIALQRWPE